MRITHHMLGLGRIATLLVGTCIGGWPALAGTTQVAMFTGFLAVPGTGTGMDILNAQLSTLGLPDYQGQVFSWENQQGAFDWLQQTEDDRSTLVIVGHSFGGNGALQLAGEYLLPAGVSVDLTVQIDPVQNWNPGSNSLLPANVDVGYNYYQESTGFFEPQGEDFVSGALNFNAEILFDDPSITHNSLDNDPRLHALIGQHILDNLNVDSVGDSADFDADRLVSGADFRTWQLGFGTVGSATLSSGDANGDRNVDDQDLLIWQQQYGGSAALTIISVPEPTGLALMLGGTYCGVLGRRRQDRLDDGMKN